MDLLKGLKSLKELKRMGHRFSIKKVLSHMLDPLSVKKCLSHKFAIVWGYIVRKMTRSACNGTITIIEKVYGIESQNNETSLRKVPRSVWKKSVVAIRFVESNWRQKMLEAKWYISASLEPFKEGKKDTKDMENVRDYISSECKLIEMTKGSYSHIDSDFNDKSYHPVIMLFSKIKEVEMETFTVSDNDIFLTNVESALIPLDIKLVRKVVKCILVFKYSGDNVDKIIGKRFQRYLNDSTVIATTCVDRSSVRSGIVLSGKKVYTRLVAVQQRQCCLQNAFSTLKYVFDNVSGLAYIRSRRYWRPSEGEDDSLSNILRDCFVLDSFSRHFPNVRLYTMERCSYVKDRTKDSLIVERCERCTEDEESSADILDILFILFEGTALQSVRIG